MSLVPFAQSSLMQALAAEAGAAMRDVDPLDVLRSAKTAQRMFRGYMGRRKASNMRRARPSVNKKRKTTRLQPSRNNELPVYAIPPDTGPGAVVRFGQLINNELPVPAFNSNNVGDTDSMMCDVRGYKICREFYWDAPLGAISDRGPIEVHWALIQWKCPISQGSVNALLPEKFFRANYFNDKKAVVFGQTLSPSDAYATPGDPWEMKLNCLSMNPNNGYNIITHRKRVIMPVMQSGYPDVMIKGQTADTWKINYYQKINRLMETEDKNVDRWKNPIYEVYWINAQNARGHPTDTSSTTAEQIRTNVYHKCFYKSVR